LDLRLQGTTHVRRTPLSAAFDFELDLTDYHWPRGDSRLGCPTERNSAAEDMGLLMPQNAKNFLLRNRLHRIAGLEACS
jgi:hypothetical protein